ncbi:unnamed protein product [Gadus morhua 'NCC']
MSRSVGLFFTDVRPTSAQALLSSNENKPANLFDCYLTETAGRDRAIPVKGGPTGYDSSSVPSVILISLGQSLHLWLRANAVKDVSSLNPGQPHSPPQPPTTTSSTLFYFQPGLLQGRLRYRTSVLAQSSPIAAARSGVVLWLCSSPGAKGGPNIGLV